jgi:hypothetical protein
MQYFLRYALILLFLAFAANNVLAENTYLSKNTYISPTLELGDNYVISPALGAAYSSAFNPEAAAYEINIYSLENSGDYLFQGVFPLPELGAVNSMIVSGNYLVVLSDQSVSFYSIDTFAQLSFAKTQDISDQIPLGATLNGAITAAGQDRYTLHSWDGMHLFSIDTTSQSFTVLDSLSFTGSEGNNVSNVTYLRYQINSDSLWVFKNTDAVYSFECFDLSSQTFNLLEAYEYTFSAEFDARNEAGLIYAHHDTDSNAVVVQNDRRTFIFQLNANDMSVTLAYSELQADDVFLAGSPSSDSQLIARNGLIYLLDIDWENLQPTYANTSVSASYWKYDFISANDILGQDPFEGNAELYTLQQGIFSATQTQFKSQLSDAIPKRLITSLYDEQASRILMLGSAASTSTLAKLYIWQYNSQEDTADFITSELVLPHEADGNFYNFEIVGSYNDYIYVYTISNLTLRSEILVFQLVDGALQLLQNVDWSGSSDIVVNDFALVAGNKIALFPYVPAGNSYFIRLCDISEDGMIQSCADKTILEGRTFQEASNSFEMIKLQNTEQLLLAPKQTIFKNAEPEVSTWLFKYNVESEQFDNFQTLDTPSDDSSFYKLESVFTYKQGSKLSLRYGQNQTFSLEWNSISQQWDTLNIQPETAFLSAPMATAEETYFINGNGRPYILDSETENFYRGEQTINLGNFNSTYQMADGNKGYILDIDSSSRLITFELANTKPVQYKGDMAIGSVDAIQDIPFDVNLGSYFLNLDSDSIELLVNGGEPVTTLSPQITWNGRVLSGVLNNEDMFTDEFSSQEASTIFVQVSFENRLLDSFGIVPINVNDAPVLTEVIETQNLETGEAYEGSLNDIVIDPDREVIIYSYANLPAGMTGTDDGRIQGSIANEGSYAITVTATDPNGAALVFTINIVVSNSAPPSTRPPTESSGGGSMAWFSLVLMLLYIPIRRRKRKY